MVHTFPVNKFDSENNAILMAIIDGEGRHPKPTDGPANRFPVWNTPLVKVGEIYGHAYAWTRSYGLVGWRDEARGQHFEWFPGVLIKQVERGDWHGR